MGHSSIRNALSHKICPVTYTTVKYYKHTFRFCHIFLSDYVVRAWGVDQRHSLNLRRMEYRPHFLPSQKASSVSLNCLLETLDWPIGMNTGGRLITWAHSQRNLYPFPTTGLFNLGQYPSYSRIYVATTRDIFGCHKWGVLLASVGKAQGFC